MTEPTEDFVVDLDDPEINQVMLTNRCFDIVAPAAQPPGAVQLTALYALVDRFQALKEKTGCNKDSSYRLSVGFGPWEPDVSVEWGCYEIGDYPRHYSTECARSNLLTHMSAEIAKMEQVAAAEDSLDD